jgi:hypothetical protein
VAGRAFLAVNAALLSFAGHCTASAQEAVETAQVRSGAGQSQGRPAQSLGSAFSNSMNDAAVQWRSMHNSERVSDEHEAGTPRETYTIPANADPLEGTDAPSYKQGNGPSIRVSGTLIQGPQTTCSKNCPEVSAGSKAAP